MPEGSLVPTNQSSLIEQKIKDLCSAISHGEKAPKAAPGKIGDFYVDTKTGDLYFAKGTDSVKDWVKLSHARASADEK